jgi:hypothetical protein
LDAAFARHECSEALQEEIKTCVFRLEKWVVCQEENRGKDHSKYLNFKFKIENSYRLFIKKTLLLSCSVNPKP